MNAPRERARGNRVFPRARQFLDACIDTEGGAALAIYELETGQSSRGAALSFRGQCHDVRSRDRTRALKLPKDDPSYGSTPYDDVHISVVEKEGLWYVVGEVYPTIELDIVPARLIKPQVEDF